MRTLLAITAYNQVKHTLEAFHSIPSIDGLDIFIVDDHSNDSTISLLEANNCNIIKKTLGQV